jgi:signal peptidase
MNREHGLRYRLTTIVGAVLCLIMVLMLIINITLIAKSYIGKEKIPDVCGYIPLIMLTDSMNPDIKSGDLIICRQQKAENVKVGDVIAFYDPAGRGTSVVTHQVVELVAENGVTKFRTKGIANSAADEALVPADNLVGVYMIRIPKAGRLAMFIQTPAGIVVCIAIPLLVIIGYDCVRHILYDREYEKNKEKETEEFIAELERLRAERRAMKGNGEK